MNVVQPRPSRPQSSWFGGAAFVALAGLLGVEVGFPCVVGATHETDHRFTVSGYVRDKEGKPVVDARVHVRDLRDQSVDPVGTYTDGSGYYKVVIHLHNNNVGDSLQVTVKDDKAGLDEAVKFRAEFDPQNRHAERQARVDIGKAPEKASDGGLVGAIGTEGPPYWVYGAGGLLVSGAIGVAVAWSRRRQAKQSKAGSKRRGKKR